MIKFSKNNELHTGLMNFGSEDASLVGGDTFQHSSNDISISLTFSSRAALQAKDLAALACLGSIIFQ